jgi:DNA-binding beta-propeller fold protein YncE
MRKLVIVLGALALAGSMAAAQGGGPYKVTKTAKVGGAGGFDYIYADADARRLYIPRSGAAGRITVYNLDSLAPAGEIPGVNAHGVAVDPKSGHAFASSKPVAMWDTKTLSIIKMIDVQGNPDGISIDPFNGRIWVFSHSAPNATIIDPKDGSIVGTLDLGGAPEEAASDGKGRMYVDLEDKDAIAVVDTKAMKVLTQYDISASAKAPAGLALDAKNHILFAACRNAPRMVILNAETGKVITTLPIGTGVDGAGFNPATMEAISSQGDGTLTVVKENSPTSFAVEQTVQTMNGARTMTIDRKTNRVLTMSMQFTPPPAPPAGAPAPTGRGRGRGTAVPDSFTIIEVGR